MKNIKTFIFFAIIFICIIISGIFTLGSTENFPSSPWTQEINAGESFVILKLDNATDIKSVWLNAGKTHYIANENENDGKASVKLLFSSSVPDATTGKMSSVSSPYTVKFDETVNGQYGKYKWIYLDGITLTGTKNYVRIETSDVVDINEIVFLNSKDEKIDVEVYGANVSEKLKYGDGYKNTYYKYESLPKESTASAIIDEQSKFLENEDFSKLNRFTDKEESVASAIAGLIDYSNVSPVKFNDKTVGVLGEELILAGVSVFGLNPLGIRIIPYFFFILSVIGVFLVGKKLFTNGDLALIVTALYAVCGFFATLGSTGGAKLIALTFVLFSFEEMLRFKSLASTKKRIRRGKKLAVPLILSGACYGLALASDLTVLIVLGGLIAIFVMGIINLKKSLVRLNSELEDSFFINENNKSYKSALSITVFSAVMGFVFVIFALFVLFYIIVAKPYGSFYGVNNLFDVMIADLSGSFSASNLANAEVAGTVSSSAWQWLLALKSEDLFASTVADGNAIMALFMNPAVQYLCLASAIFTIVYIIVSILRKTDKQMLKQTLNRFIIISAAFLPSLILPLFFNRTLTLSDYAPAALFILFYMPLACDIIKPSIKISGMKDGEITAFNAVATLIIGIALIIAVVFYGLGFCSAHGIVLSETTQKILTFWWIK